MKKKNLIFLILFFLLCSNFIRTQVSKDPGAGINGYNWLLLDEDEKIFYITGYSHSNTMTTFFVIKTLNKGNLLHKKISKEEERRIEKILIEQLGGMKIPFGQIKDGLDEIYKDYSNKLIYVHYLIPYVSKKISGEISAEEMEKQLQEMRKSFSIKR